jgi:hypothetical protein
MENPLKTSGELGKMQPKPLAGPNLLFMIFVELQRGIWWIFEYLRKTLCLLVVGRRGQCLTGITSETKKAWSAPLKLYLQLMHDNFRIVTVWLLCEKIRRRTIKLSICFY